MRSLLSTACPALLCCAAHFMGQAFRPARMTRITPSLPPTPSLPAALVRAAAAGLRRREAQHLSNILLSLGLLPHPGCQPCRLAGPLEGPGEEGPGAGAGAEAAPAHVTQEQLAGFRQELARRLRWGCSSAARPPSRLDLVAQNISQAVWDLAALQVGGAGVRCVRACCFSYCPAAWAALARRGTVPACLGAEREANEEGNPSRLGGCQRGRWMRSEEQSSAGP